jgi:hypothetical protein
MKKNPLEEIYESKVLASESVPSNKVKGEKELDTMIHGKKAQLVSGQGADKVKDVEKPEEAEGTDVKAATPKVLKDSVEEAPKKSFEGSFEKLFKATINEQFGEEMPEEENEIEFETDVEVPTSEEGMVDELEGEKDEVSDLVSDLKSVMSHLQNILDKISEESVSADQPEELETEFGDEEAEEELESEENEEEKPMGEATELKPLGDKSKVLQNKNNKVGSIKAHGGKAHGGDVDSDPELKPAKSFNKALQSPKGKAEVGNVKKGDFFK